MKKLNTSSDAMRAIDNMEESNAIDPYTPKKVKHIASKDLFNADGYKAQADSFSETDETIVKKKRVKMAGVLITIIASILLIACIMFMIIVYVNNVISEKNILSSIDKFTTVKSLIKVDKLPIQSILSKEGSIDTDKDGLTNAAEISIGSNTCSKDTDQDGIADNIEWNEPQLHIIGYTEKEKKADREYMGYKSNSAAYIVTLDTVKIAKALHINSRYVLGAYKVYNPVGKIKFKQPAEIKTLIQYVPKYNGFKVLKYGRVANGIEVDIASDSVVIGFNLSEKDLFKMISYKRIPSNINTSKYCREDSGLINYDSMYDKNRFNDTFKIEKDTLAIPTLWSKFNGANGIGQAWFTGAIYNGASIKNYDGVLNKYPSQGVLPQSNYRYNLAGYDDIKLGDIQFKSSQLTDNNSERSPIDVDKLQRPDKEIAGAIVQLNNIALDKAIKQLVVKDYSVSKTIISEISNELSNGRTVLVIMRGKDNIHALLIYGLYQSEIDKDIYNIAVYDSNINNSGNNSLQIMQISKKIYSKNIENGNEYISINYGIGGDYEWSTQTNDAFIFYKINKDLSLECIR